MSKTRLFSSGTPDHNHRSTFVAFTIKDQCNDISVGVNYLLCKSVRAFANKLPGTSLRLIYLDIAPHLSRYSLRLMACQMFYAHKA